MPIVISTNGQTRCRNSYDSSAQARLSLRVNGEEKGVVITDTGAEVPAGFDAPTAAPTIGTNGAGNVPVGFYVYRYAYASSRYPFVANDNTGGGEEWPRSNPSPASAVYQVTPAAESNSVTVTYSTRSDVDWIWVYRTPTQTTAALATAQDAAGNLFYVGRIANDTAGGTVAFTDNSATNTGEIIEADNFTCPLFWHTVFDGYQWWGWGNKTLEVVVTLNGTGTVTLDTAQSEVTAWFSGRDTAAAGFNGASGPSPSTISFLGITTGGYDGRGNFYLRVTSPTTLSVYNSSAIVTPTAIPASSQTTAFLTAPGATLYRSKVLNPFSWGQTEELVNDGVPTRVPSLFAEPVGGGLGTAISLIPDERILKLDTESPERSYALDLNAADSSQFIGTLRTLDAAQSVGSHFSQFPMRLDSGQTTGAGVNAKALQLLSSDAQSQIPIGSNVIETLRRMRREDGEALFFHGVYDRVAELNCWWVKTTDADVRCDTLIYQHAPTGTWGTKFTPGLSASATVYDDVTLKFYTFVGTEDGLIGAAFFPERFRDYAVEFTYQPEGDYIPTGALNVDSLSDAQFSMPSIQSVFSASRTSNIITVEIGEEMRVQPGEVVMMSIVAVGNFVMQVLEIVDSTHFTGYNEGADTTFSLAGGGVIVEAFGIIPVVVWNLTNGNYWLVFGFGGDNFSLDDATGNPIFNWSNVDDAKGINLFTGEYETDFLADNTSYSIAFGAIPIYLNRYFNSGTPELSKQNVEVWSSIEHATAALNNFYVRFLREYDTTLGSTISGYILQPQRDVLGASGVSGASVAVVQKTPPDILAHAFGVGWVEFGYAAYRQLDFTLKQKPT